MKKKILFVNEYSTALSGFGTYGKEVLSRLYSSGKFEIAEFAIGATTEDVITNRPRWKTYPNNVREGDARHNDFHRSRNNVFGEWRFNRIALDFQPDIVFDIRDPWCFTFEGISPLRKFYHWCIMPTVDSEPQREQWLEMFEKADSVFTYSDWGGDVLNRQTCGKVKYIGTASPGVNLNTLKPVADKKEHRKLHGIEDDAIIFGTVMRNQVRKLYPDLFHAFRIFIDKYPELAKKAYLYCHVSYPDGAGWDIPYWLKYFNVEDKVLFSYFCSVKQLPFYGKFQDSRTYSPWSNAATGTMPNVSFGYNEQQMADMYNLFDAYVQYAICEGFGMPMAEAAACGIPIMAIDYSAMHDVVEKTKGFPLKVERMFIEHGTGALRAYPDNEFCADTMARFISLSAASKKLYSDNSRKAAERYFDWNKTGDKLIEHFDSIELTGTQGQWRKTPPSFYEVPTSIPNGMSNKGFINWLYNNVLDEPSQVNSVEALGLLRDLNLGYAIEDGRARNVSRQDMFELFYNIAQNKQLCEKIRGGVVKAPMTDYIQCAHLFGE